MGDLIRDKFLKDARILGVIASVDSNPKEPDPKESDPKEVVRQHLLAVLRQSGPHVSLADREGSTVITLGLGDTKVSSTDVFKADLERCEACGQRIHG